MDDETRKGTMREKRWKVPIGSLEERVSSFKNKDNSFSVNFLWFGFVLLLYIWVLMNVLNNHHILFIIIITNGFHQKTESVQWEIQWSGGKWVKYAGIIFERKTYLMSGIIWKVGFLELFSIQNIFLCFVFYIGEIISTFFCKQTFFFLYINTSNSFTWIKNQKICLHLHRWMMMKPGGSFWLDRVCFSHKEKSI